jgi:hypothetical protein
VLEELLKDPSKIGATLLLLAAVAGFFWEQVVPGSRYRRDLDQLRKERDEATAKLDRALSVMEQTQRVRGGGFIGLTDTPDAR